MAGGARSEKRHTGVVVHMRGDVFEQGLHAGVGVVRAAGHHAGPVARAFLAAGDAEADVVQAGFFERGAAAVGIGEV